MQNSKMVAFQNLFQKKIIFTLLVGMLFFLSAFLTLSHYGISWDEPTHFKRGQGYLWYLLTGDNDYRKLPPYDLTRAQTDSNYHERSLYQDDKHNAAFYRTIDGSHPPLADIMAAVTNMIFYQKLGWLGDVESYHLFEIFVAGIGVAVLFLFVYESFGLLSAALSAIFFATYPLFWAESHFNIKDPVETSWIILTLYFLWKGVKEKAVSFIFISAIFAGFALGTKFNVIFLPFIILPWFLVVLKTHRKELMPFLASRKFLIPITFYPVIMFLIFYLSYPFLWENPITNIGKVLTYYQRNALDPAFASAALTSWPFYAIRWVILTAPPPVILGLLLSVFSFKNNLFKHYGFLLLILMWLVVTIFRVSIPGVNIYGGTRQIMEYIPTITILAGIGICYLIANLKSQISHPKGLLYLKQIQNSKISGAWPFRLKNQNWSLEFVGILVLGIWSLMPLFRLHPNENIYFNFLAGGLKGAVVSGVPAAGNSFGNAYYQGIGWINKNVELGAKLALIQGSPVNIPRYYLRQDINLSNDHFSGINLRGEYLIELTFNWEHRQNFYAWEYIDKFLEPVYEVRADGVSILKVWKNDLGHTKPEYRLKEQMYEGNLVTREENNIINLEAANELLLSRLVLVYNIDDNCTLPNASVIETSLDGRNWLREKDPLIFLQVGKQINTFKPAWENPTFPIEKDLTEKDETINFYFAARPARFIRLVLDDDKSCILNNPRFKVWYLRYE